MSDDDMLSAARIGMMRAIERFDPGVGVKFISYMPHVCFTSMLQEIGRELAWFSEPHKYLIGEKAWTEEFSSHMARRRRSGVASGSTPLSTSEWAATEDFDPGRIFDADAVRMCLGSLSEADAEVIRMRFGLDGEPEMTFVEIAAELTRSGRRVSKQRVEQIVRKAIETMRSPGKAMMPRSRAAAVRAEPCRAS